MALDHFLSDDDQRLVITKNGMNFVLSEKAAQLAGRTGDAAGLCQVVVAYRDGVETGAPVEKIQVITKAELPQLEAELQADPSIGSYDVRFR